MPKHLCQSQFEWKNHRNSQRLLFLFRFGFSPIISLGFYFQSLWYLDFMCENSNMQMLNRSLAFAFNLVSAFAASPPEIATPIGRYSIFWSIWAIRTQRGQIEANRIWSLSKSQMTDITLSRVDRGRCQVCTHCVRQLCQTTEWTNRIHTDNNFYRILYFLGLNEIKMSRYEEQHSNSYMPKTMSKR